MYATLTDANFNWTLPQHVSRRQVFKYNFIYLSILLRVINCLLIRFISFYSLIAAVKKSLRLLLSLAQFKLVFYAFLWHFFIMTMLHVEVVIQQTHSLSVRNALIRSKDHRSRIWLLLWAPRTENCVHKRLQVYIPVTLCSRYGLAAWGICLQHVDFGQDIFEKRNNFSYALAA